ncbi:MAG: hypothetical protein AB1632_03060 [Nitrospirota bacterium]
MKACYICHDTEDISSWKHPVSGQEYVLCNYCLKTIVGVCAECDSILSKLDPIGINNEGQRICYKCSAMHDMADDEQ